MSTNKYPRPLVGMFRVMVDTFWRSFPDLVSASQAIKKDREQITEKGVIGYSIEECGQYFVTRTYEVGNGYATFNAAVHAADLAPGPAKIFFVES